MTIIDFHTHIFPPDLISTRGEYAVRDRWFRLLYSNSRARMASAEDLVRSMDAAGVDRAVAFGFAFADQGLCRWCNSYVLDAARRYPDRLIPFAVLNPGAPGAEDEALRVLGTGAYGIGELMPDAGEYALTDWGALDPVMDIARQAGVPVLIHVNEQLGHVYEGKGGHGPDQAYRLAQHYPNNTLIFAHWGGGLPFYELMPEVRQSLRRVYYDTAASLYLYDDAVFRHVLSWAADKVLWATDYPLISQKRFVQRVAGLALAPDLLAKLMGDNAAGLLRRAADSAEKGM